MAQELHSDGASPQTTDERHPDGWTDDRGGQLPDLPPDEEARLLIAELAAAAESGIRRAQELMRLRDLEDLVERSAEAAIDNAASDRGVSAIDAALSSVADARAARREQTQALSRWIQHIERVGKLLATTDRVLGLPEQADHGRHYDERSPARRERGRQTPADLEVGRPARTDL